MVSPIIIERWYFLVEKHESLFDFLFSNYKCFDGCVSAPFKEYLFNTLFIVFASQDINVLLNMLNEFGYSSFKFQACIILRLPGTTYAFYDLWYFNLYMSNILCLISDQCYSYRNLGFLNNKHNLFFLSGGLLSI